MEGTKGSASAPDRSCRSVRGATLSLVAEEDEGPVAGRRSVSASFGGAEWDPGPCITAGPEPTRCMPFRDGAASGSIFVILRLLELKRAGLCVAGVEATLLTKESVGVLVPLVAPVGRAGCGPETERGYWPDLRGERERVECLLLMEPVRMEGAVVTFWRQDMMRSEGGWVEVESRPERRERFEDLVLRLLGREVVREEAALVVRARWRVAQSWRKTLMAPVREQVMMMFPLGWMEREVDGVVSEVDCRRMGSGVGESTVSVGGREDSCEGARSWRKVGGGGLHKS